MYLWVIRWKVDKGLSLWEATKSINISHKQILNWKQQLGKMKNKNNQHAKSLGDGVTSFHSPYTDNLLSFIFEMRETGMAVSVNSIVLKALPFYGCRRYGRGIGDDKRKIIGIRILDPFCPSH